LLFTNRQRRNTLRDFNMVESRWQAICRKCGRSFRVSDADSLRFLDTGWPRCCDYDMKIMYFPNGAPKTEPPPSPRAPSIIDPDAGAAA
jgi:hypothetical protein